MLTAGDCFRVVAALVADELAKARHPAAEGWPSWTAETTVDEDGVGVDSLARLDLVSCVNEALHLHETGVEDYFLTRRTLGDWAELAAYSLSNCGQAITFATSGSSGAPKRVTQPTDHLRREAAILAHMFADRRRVLSLIPPHHIYGFLHTVLLPQALDVPVADLRALGPMSVLRRAEPGDLVVATPLLWDHVLREGSSFPGDVMGVTSSAPTPPALWRRARQAGLARVVEVYGSTETGGVGWRVDGSAPFALFDHWARVDGAHIASEDGAPILAPDHVDWTENGGLYPVRRRDEAVQVGGVNVFPDQVRACLISHPVVADCAVRLDGAGPQARLKAFVVPANDADKTAAQDLGASLSAYCAERLRSVERPAQFAFGDAVPRTDTGKLADWG